MNYYFIKRLKKAIKCLIKKDIYLSLSKTEVEDIFNKKKIKNFIQIGANDGHKNDLLHDYVKKNSLSGILVEPVTYNIEKLRKTYEGHNSKLIFEQVGIGDRNDILTFYSIANITDNEPTWYDQIGTFDKDTFIKNVEVVEGLLDRMMTENIQMITFQELISRNSIKNVDLLVIDTEGYDYKIINSIDFNKIRPKIVVFEKEWMRHYEIVRTNKMLLNLKYQIFDYGIDTIAVSEK